MVLNIIYEDENIIVVNKEAGMLSVGDRYDKEKENLYLILLEKYGTIYIVHRLDKDTSGVICFAKNKEIHKELCVLFETRKVKKRYLAVVKGCVDTLKGKIDFPIKEDLSCKGKMVISKNGKPSITEYRTLERFKKYSLIEAVPLTGRTHQIRVHLSAIGFPLAIDPLYGDDKPVFLSEIKKDYRSCGKEVPLIKRLTLHSYKLEFYLPSYNKELNFESPLPKDFLLLLKYLRKYNSLKIA